MRKVCVVVASRANYGRVKYVLKAIEKRLGRMPEDKKKGIVKIDIDLLTYDGEVLKVNDWKREYVCQGVMELS